MKVPAALGAVAVGLLLTACPQAAAPTVAPPAAASPTAEPTEEPSTAGCLAVEEPTAQAPTHFEQGGSYDDYSSDPPSSGPHDPRWAENGTIYNGGVTVGELVHSLEHGTVVFWTNGLTEDETDLAEEALNEISSQGYGALIMVHDHPMDARFVMTAWGYYQECAAMDAETAQAMQAFVDSYYGSGMPEGIIACSDEEAQGLPGCEKWADQLP